MSYIPGKSQINLNDEYEKMRAKVEERAIQDQHELDKKRSAQSQEMFKNRSSLEKSIKENIFPCVFKVQTTYGVIGTGFFYYPNWLVSNAHVFPTFESFQDSILQNDQGYEPLRMIESFHRPTTLDTAPDFVTAHTDFSEKNKGLRQVEVNNNTRDKYYFYVYYNESKGMHEIRFLEKQENEVLPLKFVPQDGFEPPNGCSGAPIMEAFLDIVSHEPKWVFQVVGAVYARCINPNQTNIKLLCGIPLDKEFIQILHFLQKRDNAEHSSKMSGAHLNVGHSDNLMKSKEYDQKVEQESVKAFEKLLKFEAGESSYYVTLPLGLEKLYGVNIIQLKDSLFLEDARRRIGLPKNFFKENAFPAHYNQAKVLCTLQFLQDEFNDLMKKIRESNEVELKGIDQFWLSTYEYFRVDIRGGVNDKFVLTVQDCIGKKLYLSSLSGPNKGKPVSSTFAIAKWPAGRESRGDALAYMLQYSFDQRNKQNEIIHVDLEFVGNILKDKKKRKDAEANDKSLQEVFKYLEEVLKAEEGLAQQGKKKKSKKIWNDKDNKKVFIEGNGSDGDKSKYTDKHKKKMGTKFRYKYQTTSNLKCS